MSAAKRPATSARLAWYTGPRLTASSRMRRARRALSAKVPSAATSGPSTFGSAPWRAPAASATAAGQARREVVHERPVVAFAGEHVERGVENPLARRDLGHQR